MRNIAAVLVSTILLSWTSSAIGSPILVTIDGGADEILPGTTFDVLFSIRDAANTPLFGYSLDIDLVPDSHAVGVLSADISLTNFFDDRNLITAGGAIRDPSASDWPNGCTTLYFMRKIAISPLTRFLNWFALRK